MHAGKFIQWQDLFVVFDDGSIPVLQYEPIEIAMREQAQGYRGGIACFVILPPDTKPPPDNVKLAVKHLLTRLASQLSCLSYVVEGTGFKGVAARATLVGMKIFSSRPYPIYVETTIPDALGKVIPHLVNGHTTTVAALHKLISDTRLMWQAPAPTKAKDSSLTVK